MRGPEKNKNRSKSCAKENIKPDKSRLETDTEESSSRRTGYGKAKCERNTHYTITRLEYIRLKLQRGDKKQIAYKLHVHPEWVSQVIRGKGISEPVLQEAERIIQERNQ